MAVWLQTAEGKTKEYKTTYEIDGGLDDPTKFAIKCKGELKNRLPPRDECDHLDCAIFAAEYTAKRGKTLFKISFAGYMFWVLMGVFVSSSNSIPWAALSGGGVGLMIALFGIYNIYLSNKYAKKSKELIEFRDHGTINDIKASRIFKVESSSIWKMQW